MRLSSPAAVSVTALLSLALVPALSFGPAGAAEPAPTCDGKAATIVVVPPTEGPTQWTVGTPGDDVIVGTDKWDKIDGAGGNDTVCGLAGADEIVGGPGDDRLFGGDDDYFADDDYWGDVIQPGPGDDYVDLGADIGPDDMYWVDRVYGQKVSYADAPGPVVVDLEALTATGHGNDTFAPTPADKYTGVVGSPYDDRLSGGPAHDQIHGGGGDDVITGGAGEDLLDGDAGSGLDHESKSADGDDVVTGGPGDDTLSGGHGRDEVRGNAGDDYLVAQDDAEGTLLLGGPGEDVMEVTPGVVARGGAAADELRLDLKRPKAGETPMTVAGGSGRDRISFEYFYGRRPGFDLKVDVPRRVIRHHGRRWANLRSVERFRVDGNEARGKVVFRGGPKPEQFQASGAQGFVLRAFGGRGNDDLIGADRNDLLHGGPGRDRLRGGDGRDRCIAGERLRSCERRR